MKLKLFVLAVAVACSGVISGCVDPKAQADHNQAVMALSERMSPEWLNSHVVKGKTTKEEITSWFGKPFSRTTSSSSMMWDEMWTYTLRFSNDKNGNRERWTRSAVFMFKGDTVSQFTTSGFQF